MGEKVELSVQSDLSKVLADLQAMQTKARGVGDNIKRIGDDLDNSLKKNTKRTESHLERLRDLGRRVADQLRGYFANIANSTAAALEGVKKDLGLQRQFKDATAGAVELHDVIRKIGSSLGITSTKFVDFQQRTTTAFGDLGYSQEEAARALQGVAQTQVSGEENVLAYGTTAAKLGTIGGQQDQTGAIAKALADVLRARGIDQNDTKAMSQVAESVRGRNPLEKLGWMENMYRGMGDDKRKEIGPEAMRGMLAVRKTIGPEVDSLIKELTETMLKRLPKEAQGLGKIVGKSGINFDELEKQKGLLKRIGFDKVASAQTAGFSEDAAQALVRLLERSGAARDAQQRAMTKDGAIDDQMRDSRGLMENMGAVKNQVTGTIGGAIAPVVSKANDVVSAASKSTIGSAALMGGGFLAAAAGSYGLSQMGKQLGGKFGGAGAMVGSAGKAAALEQITGEKTIPVWVVNTSEFGNMMGGTGLPGAAGAAAGATGAAGALGKMAAAGVGLEIGLVVGTVIEGILDKKTQGKSNDGQYSGNSVERGIYESAKGLLPLLQMFRGVSSSVDDIVRSIERGNEMKRREKSQAATSNDRRGEAWGTTK